MFEFIERAKQNQKDLINKSTDYLENTTPNTYNTTNTTVQDYVVPANPTGAYTRQLEEADAQKRIAAGINGLGAADRQDYEGNMQRLISPNARWNTKGRDRTAEAYARNSPSPEAIQNMKWANQIINDNNAIEQAEVDAANSRYRR